MSEKRERGGEKRSKAPEEQQQQWQQSGTRPLRRRAAEAAADTDGGVDGLCNTPSTGRPRIVAIYSPSTRRKRLFPPMPVEPWGVPSSLALLLSHLHVEPLYPCSFLG